MYRYKNEPVDVVIVGAGLAGLSAAVKVKEHGFSLKCSKPAIAQAERSIPSFLKMANDSMKRGSVCQQGYDRNYQPDRGSRHGTQRHTPGR